MELPHNREILRRYPADGTSKYDRASLCWAIVFYLSFLLCSDGLLSVELFCLFGVIALTRNFNALHEAFHADQRGGSFWIYGRILPIIIAPWQLGFRELKNNHIYHHRFDGKPGDPDLYLIEGSAFKAFLMALTQPEQSVFRYIKRKGLDRQLVLSLGLHGGMWVSLCVITPWSLFIIYNLVARFANTIVWWVFDYWLHQQYAYRFPSPLKPFNIIAIVWSSLFSRPNLNGVLYHYLHHRYPFVPDSRLASLQQELLNQKTKMSAIE